MPLELVSGIPTQVDEHYYDQSIVYASGLAASSDIILPNSEVYYEDDASDLLIIFNNRPVEVTRDFTVPAGTSKNKITTVYALPNDTVVRFKKI